MLASTTNFTISDTVDSFPILSALYFIKPSKFKLPAITFSPIPFSTGLLSPVINDSSKCVFPSIISPSTAILSPAFEITISPFFISSNVAFFCIPSTSIIALFGVISTNFCIASLVLSLLIPSIYLPSLTK